MYVKTVFFFYKYNVTVKLFISASVDGFDDKFGEL